jgi:hypothetical protein
MAAQTSKLARAELQRIARTESFDVFYAFVLDAIYRERYTPQAKQLKAILGKRYTGFMRNVMGIYRNLGGTI